MAYEERCGLHQRLTERFGARAGEDLYTFVAAAMAIAVSGFAAFFTGAASALPVFGTDGVPLLRVADEPEGEPEFLLGCLAG
jgi:hypothetical protein